MIGLLGQIWLWLLLSFALGAVVGIVLTKRARSSEETEVVPQTSESTSKEEDATTRVTPVPAPTRRPPTHQPQPAPNSQRTTPGIAPNTLPRNTNQSHNQISWPTEADQYQWPTERDLPSRQQRPE